MKSNAYRTLKIIIIPVILTFFVSIIAAFTLERIATNTYRDLHVENIEGINDLQLNEIIESRNKITEAINKLELDLNRLSQTIIENRAIIDDDYLIKIAEVYELTSILWFDNEGNILNSSLPNLIPENYTPVEGDPIYNFIRYEEDVLFEQERYSQSAQNNYFFSYFRDNTDGYFLQISIISNKISELTKATETSNIVKIVIKSSDSVISVGVVDLNLVMIDGSEGANMDESLKDREYYQNIIDNKTRISRIRFAKTRNFDVLEIVSPIIENDETVLLISTLYTLEPFLTLRNQIRIIVVVLSFIIMSSSFLLINYYVIVPLRALELSISSFDPLSSEYTKPKKEYIIYKDTFLALDKLSKHIDRSNKERDKLHNEIYLQSITDFLTKLPNRRNLISHINKKLNNNEEFSLIFVDIDNFKNVNDSKGHVVGDEVLKESAK